MRFCQDVQSNSFLPSNTYEIIFLAIFCIAFFDHFLFAVKLLPNRNVCMTS